ncbi:G-protein alpha subunit-domain-containing protein, partial [Amanita rubescens]
KELVVRRWNDILKTVTKPAPNEGRRLPDIAAAQPEGRGQPTEIIASFRGDMTLLWEDESVRALLRKKRVYLEHTAGFFLPDLDRIATGEYEPTDDDILRARLQTVGIQEYKVHMGSVTTSRDWCFYDVGGARTVVLTRDLLIAKSALLQSLTSFPAFDEHLSEDVKVNRLEDSLRVKIARKSNIDPLPEQMRYKIQNGAQLSMSMYLSGYGDKPNDAGTFINYLKRKFNGAMKSSPNSQRTGYFYPTSVIVRIPLNS